MTGEIRLINRDGTLIAIDTETNETVPIRLGPIDAETAEAERVRSRHTFTYGHDRDDFAAGRIAGSRYASWTMMMEQTLASFPVAKTKPTLVFHSEGGRTVELTEAMPRMVDRNLPWEIGVGDSTAFQNELQEANRIGPDEAREIMFNGGEIGIYTGEVQELTSELSDHALDDEEWGVGGNDGQLDPDRDGATIERLERLLLGQKRHVEEKVGAPVSFMTAREGSSINFGELDMAKSYMIRSLFQGSGHGGVQAAFRGADPQSVFAKTSPHTHASTVLDEVTTRAEIDEVKGIIDDLLRTTDRAMFFFHSHSVQDWTAIEEILDYAVEKRANGELDVASATGGLLLPWDLEDGDIVNENTPHYEDFEDGFWGAFGNAPAVSADRAYWRMGADFGDDDFGGMHGRRVRTNPMFPVFMVQADVRSPADERVTATVRYDLSELETADERINRTFEVGSDWTTIRTPFGHPRADVGDPDGGTTDQIALYTSDPELHVTNVLLYPC
ncbi:hypothetical protein [Halopenitus persicus]|uniref:hypothetical protein n=1 Tax=Halopenitus persicus TaxID=1048396 RepID=UPI000BBAF7F1|nr:hypothetical protein [Halopenitus persicus]